MPISGRGRRNCARVRWNMPATVLGRGRQGSTSLTHLNDWTLLTQSLASTPDPSPRRKLLVQIFQSHQSPFDSHCHAARMHRHPSLSFTRSTVLPSFRFRYLPSPSPTPLLPSPQVHLSRKAAPQLRTTRSAVAAAAAKATTTPSSQVRRPAGGCSRSRYCWGSSGS